MGTWKTQQDRQQETQRQWLETPLWHQEPGLTHWHRWDWFQVSHSQSKTWKAILTTKQETEPTVFKIKESTRKGSVFPELFRRQWRVFSSSLSWVSVHVLPQYGGAKRRGHLMDVWHGTEWWQVAMVTSCWSICFLFGKKSRCLSGRWSEVTQRIQWHHELLPDGIAASKGSFEQLLCSLIGCLSWRC